MAYGKDPKALGAVASFRQMTRPSAPNPQAKKSKGTVPYFVDMYQPSTSDIDVVRLVPGEYLQDEIEGEGDNAVIRQVIKPYISFTEHFDGQMRKGSICSAGPFANSRDRRAPCHGCDIFWDTVVRTPEGRLQSPRMGRQNKFAFSIFDYGVYHKIDQIDRATGKPKLNASTKEPYFNWVKCQGQGCDACRANAPSKVGDMRHWPLSFTHLQVLRAAETDIGKSCVTCGTENSITSLGWMCAGCGECAIDMATTSLKRDELLRITDYPYHCPLCNHEDFLTEVYECRACAPRGHAGVRASLFDVDLRLKLIASNEKNKVLQVMGWSAPRPVDPKFAEEINPVDLVARYAPDPLDRQAEKFGVARVGGPARPPATPYSK